MEHINGILFHKFGPANKQLINKFDLVLSCGSFLQLNINKFHSLQRGSQLE